MKRLLYGFVFFLVLIFLFVACRRPQAVSAATALEGPWREAPAAVDALVVERGSMTDAIVAAGVVAGVNEAWVVSETSGIIIDAPFSLGQQVGKGQRLVKVDDTILQLEMERTRTQYEAARIEAEAAERLSRTGGTSSVNLARAQSAESGARAQYVTARKRFEDTSLNAPIEGVIAFRDPSASLGNQIVPGTRVARIVDNSSFTVTIGVSEREVGLLTLEDRAEIMIPAALGDAVIEGRVSAIAAASDSSTGSYQVLISFSGDRDRIRSGMSVSLRIAVQADEQVVIVPSAALVRRGDRYAVFVDRGGTAVAVAVAVGRRVGPRVEISSGLDEGAVVILSSLSRLRSGNPVVSRIRGSSVEWE